MAMQIITLDGHAKTGKTCIGETLNEKLGEDSRVHYGIAGNFYRSITSAVFQELGTEDVLPEDERLDSIIDFVVSRGIVYEADRDLGDLQRKRVGEMVAVISGRETVQEAAQGWYNATAELADDDRADILLVDGRTPRARLEDWALRNRAGLALDVFVDCVLPEAARRSLMGQGKFNPTSAEVHVEEAKLEERRVRDMTRESYPLVLPKDPVKFDPNTRSPQLVILVSRMLANDKHIPRSVLYDTTSLDIPAMTSGALALAQAAL